MSITKVTISVESSEGNVTVEATARDNGYSSWRAGSDLVEEALSEASDKIRRAYRCS